MAVRLLGSREIHAHDIKKSNSTSIKMEGVDEETKKMVQETISKVKSQGVFDQFRKDCLADVDTKVR